MHPLSDRASRNYGSTVAMRGISIVVPPHLPASFNAPLAATPIREMIEAKTTADEPTGTVMIAQHADRLEPDNRVLPLRGAEELARQALAPQVVRANPAADPKADPTNDVRAADHGWKASDQPSASRVLSRS